MQAQLNNEQRQSIREAARQAVLAALESVNIDDRPRLALYTQALEEAKAGASEALMQAAHGNQSLAAELGGINRATLRINLRRIGKL